MKKLIFFRCYSKWSALVNQLTDEEAGRVFKAALQYSSGEDIQEISGKENIVYAMVRQSIDVGAELAEHRKAARGGQSEKKPEPELEEPEPDPGVESEPERRPRRRWRHESGT